MNLTRRLSGPPDRARLQRGLEKALRRAGALPQQTWRELEPGPESRSNPANMVWIFGAGYLLWRPVSFRHAFAAAAVPHAISNTIAVLTMHFL